MYCAPKYALSWVCKYRWKSPIMRIQNINSNRVNTCSQRGSHHGLQRSLYTYLFHCGMQACQRWYNALICGVQFLWRKKYTALARLKVTQLPYSWRWLFNSRECVCNGRSVERDLTRVVKYLYGFFFILRWIHVSSCIECIRCKLFYWAKVGKFDKYSCSH